MEEELKQQSTQQPDDILSKSAVELAQSKNANIGIIAYGKAFYFYKDVLEDIQTKTDKTIQIGHLVVLTRDIGKEIDCNNVKSGISFHSLDTTADEWLQETIDLQNKDCDEEIDEESEDE